MGQGEFLETQSSGTCSKNIWPTAFGRFLSGSNSSIHPLALTKSRLPMPKDPKTGDPGPHSSQMELNKIRCQEVLFFPSSHDFWLLKSALVDTSTPPGWVDRLHPTCDSFVDRRPDTPRPCAATAAAPAQSSPGGTRQGWNRQRQGRLIQLG